jgi:hypothetical protein
VVREEWSFQGFVQRGTTIREPIRSCEQYTIHQRKSICGCSTSTITHGNGSVDTGTPMVSSTPQKSFNAPQQSFSYIGIDW